MRAKEFINEEKTTKPLRKSAKASISGLRKNPSLDNNNNPYLAYRMGIAMAGSPDRSMYQKGPMGSNFVTTDYSEADTEIRKGAEKIMGVKSQEVTGKGSAETDLVNSQSVVATPKRNKYGV
jgi:hypothetical protein